ncbi:hypothetical protein ASPBRDRAFT_356177 [Aspergillus brasiliensis CBS 101740]|uniref:Uncharacterized protein n=1 Tax=Aspergillus brasiliensis (strain CBS 101740 / IMI 381727 / IBT 21946) TaxID=767769 RepID=A0A1L9U5F4_ASPBC|nr:hypothetical protein ASPBRDRAFT_356177 [Aspergillus brasiliensis CBS 101740]
MVVYVADEILLYSRFYSFLTRALVFSVKLGRGWNLGLGRERRASGGRGNDLDCRIMLLAGVPWLTVTCFLAIVFVRRLSLRYGFARAHGSPVWSFSCFCGLFSQGNISTPGWSCVFVLALGGVVVFFFFFFNFLLAFFLYALLRPNH